MKPAEKEIRRYLSATFLFGKECDSLSASQSLLAEGIIDSTGVLELASFLEKTFGLKVEDDDLVPGNFDSVAGIVSFVQRKAPRREAAEPDAAEAELRLA